MYAHLSKATLILKRVGALSAAVVAAAAFSYGAFLLVAVERTASRSTAEDQISALSTDLSALQSRYLGLTQGLTMERASALGLVTPSQASMVFASSEAGALTLQHVGN